MVSGVGPSNPVLDGRSHWCHLVNTVKRQTGLRFIRDDRWGAPKDRCTLWGPDQSWEAAILCEMGRRNVTYRDNAALAVQKRLNRSSCRLGLWVRGSRNHVLGGRTHWRYLANTVERLCSPAICGSAMHQWWRHGLFPNLDMQSCFTKLYSLSAVVTSERLC